MHPVHPPGYGPEFTIMTFKWKSRDISLYCYYFIHFDREYWGFSDKINMQKPRPCQESGVCDISYATYLEKPFTQIYKALYGDAMFVSL